MVFMLIIKILPFSYQTVYRNFGKPSFRETKHMDDTDYHMFLVLDFVDYLSLFPKRQYI